MLGTLHGKKRLVLWIEDLLLQSGLTSMQWGSLHYSKRLDDVLRSPCRLASCAEKALKVRRGLGEKGDFGNPLI